MKLLIKITVSIILIIVLIGILQSCKKKSLPEITTANASEITRITAVSGGNVTSNGGADVIARGVCWATTQDPTISSTKTSDGSGSGAFTSSLGQLTPNTLYYIKAYATNSEGTGYGNEVTFTTEPLISATVTTSPVTSITSNSASGGGNVTDDGGAAVCTARGVCWNILTNPTTSNPKSSNGSGTGSFSSSVTGLLPGKIYYLRAYATNNIGTAYGNEINFSTPAILATITTNAISSITQTSAVSGGNITNDGGAAVTTRGVCWNTSPNPTISNSRSFDDNGVGGFPSNITGLSAYTLYYVRAYATNSVGTAYGNEINFKSSCPPSLTVTHTVGSVAPVTKTNLYYLIAGTDLTGQYKCWITRNLGAGSQAGSAIDATETAAGWYWQFNKKQGYMHDGTTRTPNYTWITAIDENSNWIAANDPCTILLGTGWRIPTQTEWTNVETNGLWVNYNNSYASVLKLHAGGYLYSFNGGLDYRGASGVYWSSTPFNNTNGVYLVIGSSTSNILNLSKAYGFSVRCIKD